MSAAQLVYASGLQRLFHNFPSGFAGIGLLILRLALAGSLVIDGAHLVTRAQDIGSGASAATLIGFFLILCAALIGTGFLSDLAPLAVICVQGLTIGLRLWAIGAVTMNADVFQTLMLEVVMALGLAMIGPGAYSIDARLFGRQEIIIPPAFERPLN